MPGKRERISLGRRDLRRISKVVRDSERGDRDTSAPSLRTSDDGAEIVRGTFTAPWPKDGEKTVTSAVITAQTYKAKNYLTPVTGTGTKDCLISYVGGEWVLVQFDLTQLDGYSSGKSQVLGTVSGALKWIDTTACT